MGSVERKKQMTCPEHYCEVCGLVLITKNKNVRGCAHYSADDIINISGKHTSDGMDTQEADTKAIQMLKEERLKGTQREMF